MLTTPALRLEKIVSLNHPTPAGEWYDQDLPEWVVLLEGSAALQLEGREDDILLFPGDFLLIPAHTRHRVSWTDPNKETVWLALHYNPAP